MKLSEIKPLLEETKTYVLYKISAPEVGAYYGYIDAAAFSSKKTEQQNIIDAFISDAKKESNDKEGHNRGSSALINAVDDIGDLTVNIIGTADSAIEARHMRNELRVTNNDSISGPTAYPPIFDETDDDKQRAKSQTSKYKLRKELMSSTARLAADPKFDEMRAYTYDEVKRMAAQTPAVRNDYMNMLYPEFVSKYFPDRTA